MSIYILVPLWIGDDLRWWAAVSCLWRILLWLCSIYV